MLQRRFPVAQLDLNRRTLALKDLPTPVHASTLAGSAWAWAARGQWDSALVSMDSTVAIYQGTFGWISLSVESYGITVLGALLGQPC